MDFHVFAQRGDMMSATCSGTAELDRMLDDLGMSIRDTTCPNAEAISHVLELHGEPVSVGWAMGRGWIRVEREFR